MTSTVGSLTGNRKPKMLDTLLHICTSDPSVYVRLSVSADIQRSQVHESNGCSGQPTDVDHLLLMITRDLPRGQRETKCFKASPILVITWFTPWLYNGYTMIIQWLYNGHTMIIQWLYVAYNDYTLAI